MCRPQNNIECHSLIWISSLPASHSVGKARVEDIRTTMSNHEIQTKTRLINYCSFSTWEILWQCIPLLLAILFIFGRGGGWWISHWEEISKQSVKLDRASKNIQCSIISNIWLMPRRETRALLYCVYPCVANAIQRFKFSSTFDWWTMEEKKKFLWFGVKLFSLFV